MDQWGKDHKWDEIIEENGVVVETIHHPTALERAEEEARYEVLNPKPERLDYDDVYAHCKRVLRVTLQEAMMELHQR